MAEITRALIARVGVDLAKNVIQVHAVDGSGRRVVARAFKRDAFLAWLAQLPAGCLVAMEACSGAHHFGRKLRAMGLDARLIGASFVTPYRMEGKGGKNDMTDAAAICEAASRPTMRFVPIKSCKQQGVMSLHCVREGFKEERTACINQIRGLLAEAGLVFGKSPKVLRAVLADVIEDASNELSPLARLVIQQAFDHWRDLDERTRWCDRRVGEHMRSSLAARRAAKIDGIGEFGASALTASVGDFTQFKKLVNSANPAWRQSCPTPRSEWSPTERFVSGPAPGGATRPFVDVQSVHCRTASSSTHVTR